MSDYRAVHKIDKWVWVEKDGKRVMKKNGFEEIVISFTNLGPDEEKQVGSNTYPKSQAPLTWAVYEAANERAERWRQRYEAVKRKLEALEDNK